MNPGTMRTAQDSGPRFRKGVDAIKEAVEHRELAVAFEAVETRP